MALIELSTVVPAPVARVFERNLDLDAHTASMSRARERVVAASARPLAGGDTVTWAARHFGLWWRMTVRITGYDPPHRFVDEQVSGPFRRWRHEHTFAWDPAAGATVARDVIEFAAPLGAAGRAVEALVLQRYLRRLIERRNEYLLWTVTGGQGAGDGFAPGVPAPGVPASDVSAPDVSAPDVSAPKHGA